MKVHILHAHLCIKKKSLPSKYFHWVRMSVFAISISPQSGRGATQGRFPRRITIGIVVFGNMKKKTYAPSDDGVWIGRGYGIHYRCITKRRPGTRANEPPRYSCARPSKTPAHTYVPTQTHAHARARARDRQMNHRKYPKGPVPATETWAVTGCGRVS